MTTEDYIKEFARLGKIVQISHTERGMGKHLRVVQRRHEHGFSETLFTKHNGRWKSLEDKLWVVTDTETSSLTPKPRGPVMDEPLQVIYKYPLNIGPTVLNIPTDSTILKFATQDGKPYVWIEHTDPSENPEYEERKLIMRVTGENWRYKPGFVYMDTVQAGFFVGHIYEDIR